MKIISLHINNFGKLKDFNMSFEEGLNIIYGDNESGKTTLMTFIMMMFYGSKNRKKDLLDNPRKKYAPWNNELMKGHIIFEFKKNQYRLDRSFYETNNKDEVSLIDNITGERVEIPNLKEPGLYFFNMSFDTFKKSLFIDSEDLAFSKENSSEIKEKLLNLISTSDEDISYDKTRDILEKKLYDLKSKSGKKGKIINLEEKLDIEYENLEKAKKEELEKKEIIKKLDRFEKEIELEEIKTSLEKSKLEIDRLKESQDINERRKIIEKEIKKLESDKNQIYADLDQIKYDYYKKIKEKENLLESKIKLSTIYKEVREKNNDQNIEKNIHNLNDVSKIFLILFIVISIISVIYFIIYPDNNLKYLFLIVGALIIITKIFYLDKKHLFLSQKQDEERKNIKRNKDIELKLEEIESKIRGLDEVIFDYKLKLKEKEHNLDLIESYNKNRNDEIKKLKESKLVQALDPKILVNINEKVKIFQREYEEKLKDYINDYSNFLEIGSLEDDRLLLMNKEYERLKGYSTEKFRQSRYMDEIKSKIYAIRKDLDKLNKLYKSLETALRILDISYRELSNDFGPILNKKTQEIFNKLSANKYDKLLISNDFDIKYEDVKNKDIKNWQFLSSGARDQIYISLKIALAKLLLEGDKKFLLLDDIFIKFDEIRAREGLKFLYNLSDDFEQIILFTCHKRIFEYVRDDVNKMKI